MDTLPVIAAFDGSDDSLRALGAPGQFFATWLVGDRPPGS